MAASFRSLRGPEKGFLTKWIFSVTEMEMGK